MGNHVCGRGRLDERATCGDWRCGSSTGNHSSLVETLAEALKVLRMTPDERMRLIEGRLRRR